jgi:hypothetical protein
MKIRNGFVSNSSSSSFVIALPRSYKLSEEELVEIRGAMEDYDCYFEYYEEIAEKQGETEVIDEREKIQQMLESGNFEEVEQVDPVNDDVMNADIEKSFEFLVSDGFFWTCSYNWDSHEIPLYTAAKAIIDTLGDKIQVDSFDTSSEGGQITNILADAAINAPGMLIVKKFFQEADGK